MNERRESDDFVVPKKSLNKAEDEAAEAMEGRESAKENSLKATTHWTQFQNSVIDGVERVRRAARKDKKQRFTTLLHHVYEVPRLGNAYFALKRTAKPGVDGVTWEEYGKNLGENLRKLSERLKRGAFRASPAKRTYIPKADGRQRPIGIPALEDKIVQRAVVEVLNAIYEVDFLGFSYGFRPKHNQHQALDALTVGIMTKKVGWVLDADIRSFFDKLNHEWLIRMIEHRIADKRVIRLIRKWLRVGVLEDGIRTASEEGTVQGGSISPLLANIYLHYAFDLWAHQWRKKQARGEMIVVRFADDFVVGFQHRKDGERFLEKLRERLAKFGLELHSEKTRLIEFGRFAAPNREERGEGKPETFDFLGFTHICGMTRKGKFTVVRQTMRKKWQKKLQEVKDRLRKLMHAGIAMQGAYLRSVVRGHVQYYGVPMNYPALSAFKWAVAQLWWRTLNRRSQKGHVHTKRMRRIIARWLPPVRICHPYPLVRFGVVI
ncbi:MAG: Group II intron-encoded protein LtrA [Firmicutes bacterium]|nr:Group II intron-encoded protein LtrA [Bacillota bacterium]